MGTPRSILSCSGQTTFQVVNRLTILIWEAALPPCICAILTVVTYLTLVRTSGYVIAYARSLTIGTPEHRSMRTTTILPSRQSSANSTSYHCLLRCMSKKESLSPENEFIGICRNGRAGLRQDGMATDCIPNMLWASGPPIRVSVCISRLVSILLSSHLADTGAYADGARSRSTSRRIEH